MIAAWLRLSILCGALVLPGCEQSPRHAAAFSNSTSDVSIAREFSPPSEADASSKAEPGTRDDEDTSSGDEDESEPATYSGDEGCEGNYYQGSSGDCVHRPAEPQNAPAEPTAQCSDGTYSYSEHRQG